MRVLCTGAGGFISGHLTAALLAAGHEVRAADRKDAGRWLQRHDGAENIGGADLRDPDACRRLCDGVDAVYHLACDMGGMGFIASNKAACMLNVIPDANMLLAARDAGVSRFFFPSSACAYSSQRQLSVSAPPLREIDVMPYSPEDGYGWEKLFMERMCRHFREDFGLETRVARYHTIYGSHESWRGGREKVPAALCRKVAAIALAGATAGEIEVWGDGQQTRSFLYVSDCVRATIALAASDHGEPPLNIGSGERVTIADLAHLIGDIAGVALALRHVPGPLGVRGRCSDNSLIRHALGWEPRVPLREGMERTYRWVYDQMASS